MLWLSLRICGGGKKELRSASKSPKHSHSEDAPSSPSEGPPRQKLRTGVSPTPAGAAAVSRPVRTCRRNVCRMVDGREVFMSQDEAGLLDSPPSSSPSLSPSPRSAPASPQTSGGAAVVLALVAEAEAEFGAGAADSQAVVGDLGCSPSQQPPPSYPRACPLHNHSDPRLRCSEASFLAGSKAQLVGHLRARHDGAILPDEIVSSLSLWRCSTCNRYFASNSHSCRGSRPQSAAVPPLPPGPVLRFGTPDSKVSRGSLCRSFVGRSTWSPLMLLCATWRVRSDGRRGCEPTQTTS